MQRSGPGKGYVEVTLTGHGDRLAQRRGRRERVQDDPEVFDLSNDREGWRKTRYFGGEDLELEFRRVESSL